MMADQSVFREPLSWLRPMEIVGGRLTGGTVDACGDHRIAMLAAIASARCDVRLRGAECVEKSDPHFWQTLAGLRSGTEESR